MYLSSGSHYVDTRAVKCVLVARIFLADLGQILSRILEKRDVIHYGHLTEVVMLAKVPVTQLFVEIVEVMCSDCEKNKRGLAYILQFLISCCVYRAQ